MTAAPRHVLCVGAVVVGSGGVLLVRQTYGSLSGRWSIPWGYVEEGESVADAARRETREEAGIDVAIDGLVGVQQLTGMLGVVFAGTPLSATPTPDGAECDAAAFVTADELPTLDVERWCAWLATRALDGQLPVIVTPSDNPYSEPGWL